MFSDDLQEIRTVLLRGGVAPRFVKRTIGELQDHYADIRHTLLKEGYTAEQADNEAAIRIGDLREIARETLGRNELKSRISLWPKTTFLLGPVLLFPAIAAVIILSVIGLVLLFPQPKGNPSFWLMGLTWFLAMFYMYVLPVLIATTLILLARQRAIPAKFLFPSILVTAFMGTLITVGVTFPDGVGETGMVEGVLHLAGFAPGARSYSMALHFQTFYRMVITTLLAFSIWRVLSGRIEKEANN